ncbi:MAG: FAD-dependent oxidoreductase [Nitrosospira sp.]|jgi:predicted NAD/FAD-binding protein|nr:FAD-dependent oxidoreductase [Nitrosospira sp.]MBI0410781.1 FAD-dependent oxidoreductase [Nitrosospira sp.]
MKVAIIGSGIAGNVVAHHLHAAHDITVFEAAGHIGGHTHTHTVELDGERHAIDTGFIVYNDWTYPNFIALLNELGVESQPSAMSFSVRNEASGLEYNGTTLNTLFAQRRNLLRPSFHRMVRDILRFNHIAPELLEAANEICLGDYLAAGKYSPQFINNYLIPMGAAIWSTDPTRMLSFPARYFVQFFHNHGMLSVDKRPQWRAIRGGSARYVEKLTAPFRQRIHLNCPVESVRRLPNGILIKPRGTDTERYDQVFFTCHSDQALALLADASPLEKSILGAIPYQENEAVLHTDTTLLPRTRRAWAAWNYHVIEGTDAARAILTYNMNILQTLKSRHTFCVTLNRTAHIAPRKIIKRITYHHPLYTLAGVAAQARQSEINGVNRSYFCGAYWRFGFHEDGVVSALNALKHFEQAAHA